MLRLLPEVKRLCCPACSDVELRVISVAGGGSFLACVQCLRRFDAARDAAREAAGAVAAIPASAPWNRAFAGMTGTV
jgi:hypothetical protein